MCIIMYTCIKNPYVMCFTLMQIMYIRPELISTMELRFNT